MLNQILTRDLRELINSNKFKINNLSTYSTKEQIIGIWYNGKTLYRKTFIFLNGVHLTIILIMLMKFL